VTRSRRPKGPRYDDPCEWNPDANRPAYDDEVHAPADVIVGRAGRWRLCEACAALPEFRRYKRRVAVSRPLLAIVMAFYKNQGMLAEHYAAWRRYPPEVRRHVEVVIVDDASPPGQRAVEVPREPVLPRLRIYRHLEDRPWNQDTARNRGVHAAVAPWVFLTDMDHLLTSAAAIELIRLAAVLGPTADEAPGGRRPAHPVFTMRRVDMPDGRPVLDGGGRDKPHMNTFMMRRSTFWHIGGYDEEYSGRGIHCTDGMYRKRLEQVTTVRHLDDVVLWRYPREVVADASTVGLTRKPVDRRDRIRAIAEEKRQAGRGIVVLSEPAERDL